MRLATAGAVFAVWVANRKRIAAETIGRAEEQAAAARSRTPSATPKPGRRKRSSTPRKRRTSSSSRPSGRRAQDRQQAQTLEQTLTGATRSWPNARPRSSGSRRSCTRAKQRVGAREQQAAASAAKYEQLVAQQQHELERVASLTADEAKELLLKQIEGDARHDAANLLKRLDAEARETASGDRAKHYITEAIQRCAAEHAIETTVSVVDLPSDDLKGRIIGREGRNIRALELATGVDLIVDDTPGAIILSGFDPYRREIAKQAIERLIADGRIHPARIEEVVQKVKDETDEEVRKEGGGGRVRARPARSAPGDPPADGPAEVPHQLRPERAVALGGSRAARRHHGEGGRPRRARRRPRRVPARHRQGDRSRDAGHASRARHRLPAQARRERSRS